jgi:Ca-activated chloride channel family protein
MTARILLFGMLMLLSATAEAGGWPADLAGWWITPDQQGQRLFEQERYAEAAEAFVDPTRKGVAFFRAGDFESAAAVFGRVPTAEAAYNRGNALVMLGRYEEAIAAYALALERRPGWQEAVENRAVAEARLALLAPPETDAGGTGGQLGADEIVFDDSGRVSEGGSEVETEGGETLSEEEMRSVWLRRVQNDPADFLRSRFAYQLYRQEQESAGDAADTD